MRSAVIYSVEAECTISESVRNTIDGVEKIALRFNSFVYAYKYVLQRFDKQRHRRLRASVGHGWAALSGV
jgi:hypothetical protein